MLDEQLTWLSHDFLVQLCELFTVNRLRADIRDLFECWNPLDLDVASRCRLPNKVMPNCDVLRAGVGHAAFRRRDADRSLIIAVDQDGTLDLDADVAQQLVEPHRFSHGG